MRQKFLAVLFIVAASPSVGADTNWRADTSAPLDAIETRLIEREGWTRPELLRAPFLLDESDRRKFEIVTSKESCGTGGCQFHIFELKSSKAGVLYKWAGVFFGRGVISSRKSSGLFDIDVDTKVGTELRRTRLRYDGALYR